MSITRAQEFIAIGTADEVLARLCAALPKLPTVLRYYDEFDDMIRSIKNPEDQTIEFFPNWEKRIQVKFFYQREQKALGGDYGFISAGISAFNRGKKANI